MAGWVARTPGSSQDFAVDFNNQYDLNHDNRFHPYSHPQYNQQWGMNPPQQQGPMVEQAAAPQNNFMLDGRNGLYQSKDAEETFRAYMELQELISWQDSYRRGDFPMGQQNNQQYVMPVVNNNEMEKLPTTSGSDDGYGSASSIGSPASSTVSGVPSEVDNLSIASSPSPRSVFDGIDNNVPSSPLMRLNENVEGTFDIDEILNDEDNAMSPEMPYNDNQKVPFASLLSSLEDELDYANSPSALKNPSADSFFAKLSPEYNPPHTMTTRNDDPFSMQFTNSSLPDKFLSDTLVDIGDFDPSFFDNSNGENEEEMMDKALVQSLSQQKGNPAAVAIKQEEDDYWLKPGSPMVEHDYFNKDDIKPVTTSQLINKHRVGLDDFARPPTPSLSSVRRQPSATNTNRPNNGRTFAPSHTASSTNVSKQRNVKPKVKQQKQKSILWSDFPYTSNELVEMPVERFNEVIKQLDEVRQHVAKDERRKGKNKLAARNCRKRKMDIIDNLDQGVSGLEKQRQDLLMERQRILEETRDIQRKTEWLNNYIFQHMRDSNGLPYSQNDFSLQYTSDGNVYVVPSVGGEQKRN